MIYLCIKLMVALAFFYSVEPAHADDIYNFSFQKTNSQKKQVSAQKKENSIKAGGQFSVKDQSYKTWELSAGLGTVSGFATPSVYDPNGNGWVSSGLYIQQMYVVAGKWNLSRFFDFHGALGLASGPTEHTSRYIQVQEGADVPDEISSNMESLLKVGFGTTPFHFDFMGYDFLELGWDVSLFMGDKNYLGGNSSVLLWGPRGAINFSRSVALILSQQFEMLKDSGASFDSISAQLAYRW